MRLDNYFFEIPKNWEIKVIQWPYLWTQIGLSLEMLFHPVGALFIPAHTVSLIHPKNTVVTIHGLEYEFCPASYSFWERIYMRFVIKNSCRWAKKIIAVSENTKKDLIKLYKVPSEKIKVIYEGIGASVILTPPRRGKNPSVSNTPHISIVRDPSRDAQDDAKPYLLFIGRMEERKNIRGIIKAFEILKEKYKIPHKLILAGSPGYGYASAKRKVQSAKFRKDILIKGFVSEGEKWELLKNADVFLFPSFYEGFGLPILEAQSAGTPVVTSNISSMAEISTKYEFSTNVRTASAILVNPHNPEEIAEAAYKLISEEKFRDEIIQKGIENTKRFSWEKCAEEVAGLFF